MTPTPATNPASRILESLTPPQRSAAAHLDGPLLIVAGPGSGKTRVMAHRVAYLAGECGIPAYRILAVTFTNKAARELRERCEALLGDRAPGLNVRTFHSFCAQVLRIDGGMAGLDPGFSIYDQDDQQRLLRDILAELEVDTKRYAPRAVLAMISDAKNAFLDARSFQPAVGSYFEEVAARAFARYEERLRESNAVDFDDLLLVAHRLLTRNPDALERWQQRYSYLLIDEFQDTNRIQFELARLLSGKHRNICVVGDPNQSIYSWRHADPRNMLDFQKAYPDAKVVTLDQNYRSTRTIIEAAAAVIANNSGRIPHDLWTANERGSPVVVAEAYDEAEEARLVVQEAERLVHDEAYDRGQIAVMYRVNAQSRALEVACNQAGVPYQLIGTVRFYDRKEVRDVIAFLRVVANPADDVALERIINVPARGISQRTVEIIRRHARGASLSLFEALADDESRAGLDALLNKRALKAVDRFRDMVMQLADRSHVVSPAALIDLTVERTGYKRLIQEDEERGEERWDNVLELRGTAEPYGGPDPRGQLIDFLENAALVSNVDQMADGAAAPLTLITLHQAKGLEFDAVFITGLEEGLLPHMRSFDDPASMEEERRLCYVGMTRARKRLYMLRAFRRAFRGMRGASLPSRFLDELPANLVQAGSVRRAGRARPDSGRRGGPREETIRDPAAVKRAAALPSAPSAAPVEFQPGERVRHPVFGRGVVVALRRTAGDTELTVAFEAQGVKRLLLSYAPLEKAAKKSG